MLVQVSLNWWCEPQPRLSFTFRFMCLWSHFSGCLHTTSRLNLGAVDAPLSSSTNTRLWYTLGVFHQHQVHPRPPPWCTSWPQYCTRPPSRAGCLTLRHLQRTLATADWEAAVQLSPPPGLLLLLLLLIPLLIPLLLLLLNIPYCSYSY